MMPHHGPASVVQSSHSDGRIGRALCSAGSCLREMVCAVGGHDYRQHTTSSRVFLRCAECGHETAGWYLGPHRDRFPERKRPH
jgi:hypothetical protein